MELHASSTEVPAATKLLRRDLRGDALTFVAIDFETADHGPDSACAVGLVRVSGTTIVKRKYYLIRPTRSSFFFTPVHGITWEHVQRKPTFEALWPRIPRFASRRRFYRLPWRQL